MIVWDPSVITKFKFFKDFSGGLDFVSFPENFSCSNAFLKFGKKNLVKWQCDTKFVAMWQLSVQLMSFSLLLRHFNCNVFDTTFRCPLFHKPVLLGLYYKYSTFKCYRPDFWDCTLRIFENLWKILIFSIFHLIEIKKIPSYSTYQWKIIKKFKQYV